MEKIFLLILVILTFSGCIGSSTTFTSRGVTLNVLPRESTVTDIIKDIPVEIAAEKSTDLKSKLSLGDYVETATEEAGE